MEMNARSAVRLMAIVVNGIFAVWLVASVMAWGSGSLGDAAVLAIAPFLAVLALSWPNRG
jgi:hypothetical protein